MRGRTTTTTRKSRRARRLSRPACQLCGRGVAQQWLVYAVQGISADRGCGDAGRCHRLPAAALHYTTRWSPGRGPPERGTALAALGHFSICIHLSRDRLPMPAGYWKLRSFAKLPRSCHADQYLLLGSNPVWVHVVKTRRPPIGVHHPDDPSSAASSFHRRDAADCCTARGQAGGARRPQAMDPERDTVRWPTSSTRRYRCQPQALAEECLRWARPSSHHAYQAPLPASTRPSDDHARAGAGHFAAGDFAGCTRTLGRCGRQSDVEIGRRSPAYAAASKAKAARRGLA